MSRVAGLGAIAMALYLAASIGQTCLIATEIGSCTELGLWCWLVLRVLKWAVIGLGLILSILAVSLLLRFGRRMEGIRRVAAQIHARI